MRNKLKKLASKVSNNLKNLIKRYPVTLLAITFFSIFSQCIIDSTINEATIENVMLFIVLFMFGCFYTEQLFLRINSKATIENNEKIEIKTEQTTKHIHNCFIPKIAVFVLFSIISCTIVYMINGSPKISTFAAKIAAIYIVATFCASVYMVIKEKKVTFEKYLINIFSKLFMNSIIYILLALGILAVTGIFVFLLAPESGILILRAEILLLTLYYIPMILSSLTGNMDEEINLFTNGIVKYVFLTLATCASLIIFIYVMKIILFRQMPQNEVFRILVSLFLFAIPTVIMTKNYEEKSEIIKKANLIIKLLFIPFIILEIYTLGIRINHYGITNLRYLGIVAIILELIIMGLMYFKNSKHLSKILLVMPITLVIVLLTPIKYDAVVGLSQSKRIYKALNETKITSMTEEEARSVITSYRTLVENDNVEKYLDKDTIKQIDDNLNIYYGYTDNNSESIRFNYQSYSDEIDIEGYKKIITKADINMYKTISPNSSITDKIQNIESDYKTTDYKVNVDEVTKQLREYLILINYDSNLKYKTTNNEEEIMKKFFGDDISIKLTDNAIFKITDVTLNFEKASKDITYTYITGIILIK